MSKAIVNNVTRRVEVHSTGWRGLQGVPGLTWRDDAWQVGNEYSKDDALLHDGSSYRATVAHIATAETQPGAGADWESVWKVFALGTDVETAEVVAGIADAIETVAGISEAVQTVAENRQAVVTVADKVEDVSTVAERIEDVATVAAADEAIRIAANRDAQIAIVAERDSDIALLAEHAAAIATTAGIAGQVVTVSDNVGAVVLAAEKMDEIEAAPAAAQAAGEYRDGSRAWAEGVEPDGPGTKSAREYASDAAGSAATAAAATLIGYGVSIYNKDGIDPGGYYASRRNVSDNSEYDHLVAEIIQSEINAEAELWIEVGGDIVFGPAIVARNEALASSALSIGVPKGDAVNLIVIPTRGKVTEFYASLHGGGGANIISYTDRPASYPLPSSVFAAGDQGAWWDIGDITTIFQDQAGTIPVTADGQPLGVVFDKSGNGNHLVLTNVVYRTDGDLHWAEFNGTSSYAVAPSSLAFTDDMSLFFVAEKASVGSFGAVIQALGSSSNSNIAFAVRYSDEDVPRVSFSAADTSTTTTTSVLPILPGEPQLIGVSRLSGSHLDFYVDRDWKQTLAYTQAATVSNPTVYVGMRQAGTQLRFEGKLFSMLLVDKYIKNAETLTTAMRGRAEVPVPSYSSRLPILIDDVVQRAPQGLCKVGDVFFATVDMGTADLKIVRSTYPFIKWTYVNEISAPGAGFPRLTTDGVDKLYVMASNGRFRRYTSRGEILEHSENISGTASEQDILWLSENTLIWAYAVSGIIRVRKSFDDGDTWSTPITVDTITGALPEDMRFGRAANGDILIHAEREVVDLLESSSVQWRSSDGGATWTAMETIQPSDGVTDNEGGAYATLPDGTLAFVWPNNSSGGTSYANNQLYCRLSSDNGVTWGDPFMISPGKNWTAVFAHGLDDGRVLVLAHRYFNQSNLGLGAYAEIFDVQ